MISDQFRGPIGVQNGAGKVQKRGPKSDLRSSRVPGALWGSIMDGCLIIFGLILVIFGRISDISE